MREALALPYRTIFNLTTISHCNPSLLKFLGGSTKSGYPLGISAWAKAFAKQILWIFKIITHCKIYINLTVYHWITGEYNFRVSVDSIFWKYPFTQYCALNLLIFQPGFLFYLKDHVPGNTLWPVTDLLEKSPMCPLS